MLTERCLVPTKLKDVKPRVLQLDIETHPASGKFFGKIYETNIIRVDEQSFMLCFSYKWLGEKTVHNYALPDFPRYATNKHDDEQLVGKLADLLGQADFVVAYHGDRFDLPVTYTRMMLHGFSPPPPYKTIDPCKEAKRKFNLPSNKLNDVGTYFGLGKKVSHKGAELWFGCGDGDMPSWKIMRKYNNQDVVLLEAVYLKMRPWIRHPNFNVATRTLGACPKCGSKDLIHRGYRFTRTSEAPRLQCKSCGAWSTGKNETLAKKIHIV